MKKKFAIVLALFLIAVVCSAGCIDPETPVDPVDPVVPVDPVDPITPVDPVVPEEPEVPVDPVVPAEGDYTVTFLMNSAVDSGIYLTVYVDEGETVAEPAVPEKPKAQYIFVQWTTDKENRHAYDFTTPVTADLVLYADWDIMGVSSGNSHTHNYVEGEKDGKQGLLCSCGSFKPYLVEIDGESYTSVDEAITNAEDGDTITLVTAPETPINVGDADVVIDISGVDTTTPVSLTYAEGTAIQIKADDPEDVEVTITDSEAGTEKKVIFEDTPAADGLLVPSAAVDEDKKVGDAFTASGLQHLLDLISTSGVLAAPAEDAPTEHVQDGWNVLFYEPAPTALGDEAVSVPGWTITLKADIDEPVEITVPVIIAGNGFAATLKYTDFELIHVLNEGYEKITVYLKDKLVDFDENANTANCLVVKSVTDEDGNLDIYSLEGLKEFRDDVNGGKDFEGLTVTLMNDIDLSSEENWTPIGALMLNADGSVDSEMSHAFKGTFDGNDYTISNMNVNVPITDGHSAGLFGFVVGTVKDVNLENVAVSGNHYAGAVVGYSYNTEATGATITNCHVIGGTITSVPHEAGEGYDDGDKAGGIIGHSDSKDTISGCSVTGVTICAYRDIGGIAGLAAGTVTNNNVKDVTLIQDLTNGYKESVPTTIAAIIGNKWSTISSSENTDSNVEIYTVVDSIDELKDAVDAGVSTIKLGDDITGDGDETIIIGTGKNIILDLNEKTLSTTNTRTETHNFFIDVKGGTLTILDGTITYAHTGSNMAWGGATTIIDVTAGGVLNMNGVTAQNLGGTDMNFAVHMNNWGEVTLNADNCVFDAPYCGVRVFNSGPDMNNVKIKDSTLTGGTRAFWVHNYASSDFGGKEYSGASVSYDEEKVKARLNFEIYGESNNKFTITGSAASPIRYGFNTVIYFDADGNQVQ